MKVVGKLTALARRGVPVITATVRTTRNFSSAKYGNYNQYSKSGSKLSKQSTDSVKAPRATPGSSKWYFEELKEANQANDFARAVRVWNEMLRERIQPTQYHISSILRAVRGLGLLETGVAIASDWCKSDLRGTAHIVENQVLDIFARAKEAEKAFEAFAFIRKNSLQLAPYAFQSLVSMASVIQPTTIIFERLKEILDGSDPSDKTLIDAVMRGCVHNNDIGSVKKLLKFLRNTKIPELAPDARGYGSLVMLLAKNGRIDEMQRLVEEMKHYDLELNTWVYGVVIGAYADAGDRKKAEELFQEVKSNEKTTPTEAMYNSLLYMYSSLGDLPAAYALWAEFKSIGAIQPTSTSYGAIIRAFVDHGDLKMALELFRELDESSTRPMLTTLNLLMEAAARNGDVMTTKRLFDSLPDRGYSPNSRAYYAMIQAFTAVGNVGAAFSTFQQLKSKMTPSIGVLVLMMEMILTHQPARLTAFINEAVEQYPLAATALYSWLVSYFKSRRDERTAERYASMREVLPQWKTICRLSSEPLPPTPEWPPRTLRPAKSTSSSSSSQVIRPAEQAVEVSDKSQKSSAKAKQPAPKSPPTPTPPTPPTTTVAEITTSEAAPEKPRRSVLKLKTASGQAVELQVPETPAEEMSLSQKTAAILSGGLTAKTGKSAAKVAPKPAKKVTVNLPKKP